MSLNRQPKNFLSRVSFKLASVYSMGLVFSSMLLFGLIYYQVVFSFGNQGRKDLAEKLNEVAHRFELGATDGSLAIDQFLSSLNWDHNYTYYFYSAQGDLLYSHQSNESLALSQNIIAETQEQFSEKAQFLGVDDFPELEGTLVGYKKLKGGERLLIARSVKNITEELYLLKRVFLGALIPVLILGFFASLYFAKRFFLPIQEIIETYKQVRNGRFSSRLVVKNENENLAELKEMSNAVLDQVELAISNLREAFDHLAHDIRTPVTRLRGRAELALNGEESVDAYREALQSCYENSDRILRFLETLTQISEAENRALKLKVERVSLGEMVLEIMELYEIAFEEKNIAVKKILLKADWVDCDPNLLKRVIANLLDNAHKYTPEDGEVFIETYKTDKHVVLSIRDSGMGIPREELSLVWNRLFRGDKSRTAYGMGLGLTFVRAVVEAHGGSVSVLSPVADGRGTEFLIKLKQPTLKIK